MKRNSLFKGIVLSTVVSAVLTGCGSTAATNTNDDQSKEKAAASIDGKAVDGYLQYATVCLDMSLDGYCQNTEPTTQTDQDGKFTLQVTADIQAQENYDKAMLLVYGGKDVDTGVDFNGKLLAPKDGNIVNITPITTLIAKAVQKELKADKRLTKEQIKEKIQSSRKRVAQALEISEEDMGKDPVAEQKAGREDLIRKALQLQKSVEAMLLAGGAGESEHERTENIYEAFIAGLDDMQASDIGIEKLIDKTLQRAQNDERLKALLGGDEGVRLGGAAKKVAKNIKDRFEKFDAHDDDFLEKIASVTKDDLQKIKIEYENDTDDIAGQITINPDNPIFQQGFDWGAKFIKDDLHHLGFKDLSKIESLIPKIKEALKDEGRIRPGVLFVKKEKLKNAEDEELKALYFRIKKFEDEIKEKKEKEDVKRENNIVKITPPMSIYFQEERGYGQVTFNENSTISFKKYRAQENGTFAEEQGEDNHPSFIYNDGAWQAENDDAQEFSIDSTGAIILSQRNEKAYLLNEKDISGETRGIPHLGLDVIMPEGAKMSFITVEKTADTYSLHDEVQNHQTEQNTPYTSISDFIQGQCQTNWFMGDEQGGLAFKGTFTDGGYICDGSAKSGELVVAHRGSYESLSGSPSLASAGKWEIKTIGDGVDVLIVKPYNINRFENDKDEGLRYPIFALKDGQLYRGDLEPTGTKHAIPAYNETAIKAIADTVTANWQDLLTGFISDKEYQGEPN